LPLSLLWLEDSPTPLVRCLSVDSCVSGADFLRPWEARVWKMWRVSAELKAFSIFVMPILLKSWPQRLVLLL
jgi:hypothetical protein